MCVRACTYGVGLYLDTIVLVQEASYRRMSAQSTLCVVRVEERGQRIGSVVGAKYKDQSIKTGKQKVSKETERSTNESVLVKQCHER